MVKKYSRVRAHVRRAPPKKASSPKWLGKESRTYKKIIKSH